MIREGVIHFMQYSWAVVVLIVVCCGCTKSTDETINTAETELMPQNRANTEMLEQGYEIIPAQGSEESLLHVLVVVDMSGSMSKTHFIVNEILQLADGLSLNSSALQVEYIGFDANRAELVLLEELDQKFSSTGETSIYKGMEKTKEWIDEHCNDTAADTGRACVIILSDLFSSRTRTNECYNQNEVINEQNELKQWMDDWKQKEKEEKLSICFITWESLTKGEEREKTCEFLRKQIKNEGAADDIFEMGYQVVMDEKGENTFYLDTGNIGTAEELIVLEKETIKHCTKFVMELISGESIAQWDQKKANKRKHYISCKSKDCCQMFLQISLPENAHKDALKITGIKKNEDGTSADPKTIYADCIVEGQYMNLYYVRNLDEYNEIYIEPEGCIVSTLGVKKKGVYLNMKKKKVKGSGQYEVEIKVMVEWECGITERTIKVEVLDKQKSVMKVFESINLDRKTEGVMLKCRVPREPQTVKMYYLDDNGEWQFMQET